MISPQTSSTRRIHLFLLATIIVLISACSLKTLYNRLDYLIPYYLEGMVSLDGVLEKKVEQRAQFLVSWHRNTQLKEYAEWLKTIQRDVGNHSTEEKLLQHIAKLEYFWHSLSQKLNEEMAALLPLLNSEQRKELFANIAEKNQDYSDDYINVDEKKRIDSFSEVMLDNYENWFGDLTDVQEKIIELMASKLHSVADLRLKQRLRWQHGIQKILGSNESPSIKAEHLRVFFTDYELNDDAEIKRSATANRRIIAQLTVNIAHSLTPDQQAYFISKTNNYIRIFNELAENR